MIYQDSLAERLKEKTGEKWQPANGTEGEIFMRSFCDKCKHQGSDGQWCRIQTASMIYSTSESEYPQEWQISQGGQPVCTAFEVGNG